MTVLLQPDPNEAPLTAVPGGNGGGGKKPTQEELIRDAIKSKPSVQKAYITLTDAQSELKQAQARQQRAGGGYAAEGAQQAVMVAEANVKIAGIRFTKALADVGITPDNESKAGPAQGPNKKKLAGPAGRLPFEEPGRTLTDLRYGETLGAADIGQGR